MSNCAKVSLTGRLIKEPVKKLYNGTSVVSFSMAVNTTKKEGDNYVADFYNISVWGQSADFILPRIYKGAMVQVYGDLTLQAYVDKSGTQKQSLSVRATEVIPLSPKKKTDTNANNDDDEPPLF